MLETDLHPLQEQQLFLLAKSLPQPFGRLFAVSVHVRACGGQSTAFRSQFSPSSLGFESWPQMIRLAQQALTY